MKIMKRTAVVVVVLFLLTACAQRTVTQAPTWQEQYDLGMKYLAENNFAEAIIAFTAAIEIDPKQIPAYIGRADSYVGAANKIIDEKQENNSDLLINAEKDYLAAIDLDSKLVEVYSKLADMYLLSGENAKAADILRRGYAATSDSSLSERLQTMEKELEGSDEEKKLDEILSISPDFYGEIPITNLSFETVNARPPQDKEIPEGWIGYTYLHFDLVLAEVPDEISSRIFSHGIWNWDEGDMSAERAVENCITSYSHWGSLNDGSSFALTHIDSWGFPTYQKDVGKTYTVCIVLRDQEGKPIAYSLPKATIVG